MTVYLDPSDYFFLLYCINEHWMDKNYSGYQDTMEYHLIFKNRGQR